jgi:hypothetical protein
MYNCSYGVSNEVLLTCFNNVMVTWICAYSCLFFSMCRAYDDWWPLGFFCICCAPCIVVSNFVSSVRCMTCYRYCR